MLSREDIMQVKKLINAEISTRNPKAQIYDRLPGGQDGYQGEIRIARTTGGGKVICVFADNRWHYAELTVSL